MSRLAELVSRFPVRKKEEQKEAFLRYAAGVMREMGYPVRIEENGRRGQQKNLVAGGPDTARVIFTAHYDTPANMVLPNLMLPRNLPLFSLYQIGVVLILLVIALAPAFGVFSLTKDRRLMMLAFLAAYYALLLLLIMGPANKHNVNDNTSGVAAVMQLMALLHEEERQRAAFILFDNEEKGMQGSKAFALQHEHVKKDALVVNLDCVRVGDHLVVVAKNYARPMAEYALLEESLTPGEGIIPHFYPAASSVMNSDHKSFRRGVGIAACNRRPLVGFYVGGIHTRRDTRAEERNINYLAQRLAAFVKALAEV